MENLIQNLDVILKSVTEMKAGYQRLKKNNAQLEVQISDLKVEADKYIQEIIKLKKELDERAEVENISMLSLEDKTSAISIEALKEEQKSKNASIKLQLDEFIEDIDQCIQIIQAKE